MGKKRPESSSQKNEPKGFGSMSHRRNLSNIKLLLSAPEIQVLVRETRALLALPPEGLPDSHEAILDWRNKTVAQLPEIETCLYDAAEKIINLCGLPASYAESIKSYVIAGIIHAPPLAFSEGPYLGKDIERGPRKSVTITFYSKLTDDDLAYLKKYVNEIAGTFLPEIRGISDIEQKLLIEEQLSDREREDPSTGEKYRIPTREIAKFVEEELGTETTTAHVHDNKRSLKKLRDGHFKKFGK